MERCLAATEQEEGIDMPNAIKLSELKEQLKDITIEEREFRKYLEEDVPNSRAFSPAIKINTNMVDTEGLEGQVAVRWFNFMSKLRRQLRYKAKVRDYSGIRMVSEGDSWFQYPIRLDDVIDHLSKDYAVWSLGAAGDLLRDMVLEDEISEAIEKKKPHIFMISGGGNDLLGDGMLGKVLKPFDEKLKPEDYPGAQWTQVLNEIEEIYRGLFSRLKRAFPGLKILCHGYDYAIPTKGGRWLGKPMEGLQIKAKGLQAAIIRVLIDQLNDALISIAKDFGETVFHVDCRETVDPKTQWHDELHPTDDGYRSVAEKFKAVVEAIPVRRTVIRGEGKARCKGREFEVKGAKDIEKDVYRRMVERRGRKLLGPDAFVGTVADEDERRNIEDEIARFYEKVHLGADFLPASYLSKGAERASAVCRIKTPGSLGTGFLIAAQEFIMTNNHVLPDAETAEASVAEFGFEANGTIRRVPLLPGKLFITDKGLDFTIVGCDGSTLSDITPVPLLRNPAGIIRDERVNIIQHPRGRKKEVAIHDNRVIRVRDKVIHYRTDTEPGSSGSAVFNNEWELVALHHAGWADDGGTATNEGIRMAAIVGHLLRRNRENTEADRELNEILRQVADTSPSLGFFDVEGVVETPEEVEIPDFVGARDFADVGFWNIEHFNSSVGSERVEVVADVLHRMSMDVIGLVEVEDDALKKLVAALRERGDLAQYAMKDVRGRQDLAVLYDQETATVELADDISDRHKDALSVKTTLGSRAFPRQPLFARCQVEDGNSNPVKFLMIVVHFKAFGDEQSRARRRLAAETLADIIKDVRDREKTPVVLGGDFNESLNNDVLASLRDAPDLFALTADDALSGAASYVGGQHRSLIDHIVVSRDVIPGTISGDDAAIVRLDRSVGDFSSRVSDHTPIVMRIVSREDPIDVSDRDRQ